MNREADRGRGTRDGRRSSEVGARGEGVILIAPYSDCEGADCRLPGALHVSMTVSIHSVQALGGRGWISR